MPLAASGVMSLGGSNTTSSVNLELQQSATATIDMNGTNPRFLARTLSGQYSMSAFYSTTSVSFNFVAAAYDSISGSGTFNMIVPATAAAGDFAIWHQAGIGYSAVPPATTISANWTEIGTAGGTTNAFMRSRMHYRVLTAGDPGASYANQRGNLLGGAGYHILVFRPSRTIASVTGVRQNVQVTAGDPAQQTITISSLTAPGLAFGVAFAANNNAITATSSAGLTEPSALSASAWVTRYGFFNTRAGGTGHNSGNLAANQTFDSNDISNDNHLHSGYYTFTF